MNKQFRDDEELVAAVNQLPQTMKAPKGLWAGIAARLTDQPGVKAKSSEIKVLKNSGWRNQAIAASLVLAFVAGLLSGRQIGFEEIPVPKGPTLDLAMQAALEATEREYVAAFKEFIPVGTARTVLESHAVTNIEESWADLQQAESALLAAMHEYPENTYLNQKLLELRSQQLGFMRQLAMLDQFSRRKT